MRAACLLVLASLGSAVGCNNTQTITGPGEPPDPTATFSRVQREVFTPSCAVSRAGGCHAGPAPQLDLSLETGKSYARIVGVPSTETRLDLVAPGRPDDSYLVVKLRGDPAIEANRMPPGGPYLPPDQVKLIVDWIRRGAPND